MREFFRKSIFLFLVTPFLSFALLTSGSVSAAENKPCLKLEGFTIGLTDVPENTAGKVAKMPTSPSNLGHSYRLSLKEAIELALKNNKSIQIQQQEIEYAHANIVGAQSKFFPAVAAGYSYTYYDAFLPLSTFTMPSAKKDPGLFLGYKNDNIANIYGNQMIYDGGASIASLKQARIQLKIQQETLHSRILDAELNVKKAYYGLLYAYEIYRIAKYLVDQAEAHYENVRAMFEQGTASKFDVLQSRVQVSLVMPQLVNAEASMELNAADLKQLLYLEMSDNLEAEGDLAYDPLDIREKAFLDEAYANNPFLKLNALGVDLKKWAIEQAKSGWYPNINANLNYLYRSDNLTNMFNTRHMNYLIGATGTVSIFDGMATKAKVDEAKALYSESVYNYENAVEQIAYNIKQQCLYLKEAHAIILAQKDNLEEAKEALKIAYIRFDNGVGINLDVIDSQTSLGQVETNLAQGIYNYLVAQASLDQLMGREYFDSEKESKK